MKKRLIYFFLLILIQTGFAQNNLSWKGYFSYNNIKDLSVSPTAIFAASENAVFSKKIATSEIKTTNTIDGLSGQTISSLYYSVAANKTLVGYENGLMIVINDADGSMLNVVDIINKQLPANIKKINHFMEYEGIVYVSCDFGIVQFNLATMQFGDTYFIGDNGAETIVTQTTISNGYIYAATNTGIRRADILNKNLIDFSQWALIVGGSWSSIESFGTELIAVDSSGNINKFNTTTNAFIGYSALSQPAVDTRVTGNYLIITTANSIYIYNNQLIIVRQINSNQILGITSSFSCAASIDDTIYIGTTADGLITTTISVSSAFENSTPAGPTSNNVFAIESASTSLWVVYGNYDVNYNPYTGGLKSYGISK